MLLHWTYQHYTYIVTFLFLQESGCELVAWKYQVEREVSSGTLKVNKGWDGEHNTIDIILTL